MVLWLAFGSIFGVWNVFQSPGLDFRLVAIGALLPLALDAPFRSQAYAQTLLSAVIVLTVTMASTAGRGRRLRRRRALSLPIGWFTNLVMSGSWAHKDVFWWPAFGAARPRVALLAPLPLLIVEELLGLAAAWWAWTRFGLADPARRRDFWRTGRLAIEVGGR
ncbi:MAG: hypothetical protein ACLPVY_11370 [Acidimicrobiia bacterium]